MGLLLVGHVLRREDFKKKVKNVEPMKWEANRG